MKSNLPKSWDEVPVVLDIVYVSRLLDISSHTLRKKAKNGEMPFLMVSKKWLISKSDLIDWLENNKIKK